MLSDWDDLCTDTLLCGSDSDAEEHTVSSNSADRHHVSGTSPSLSTAPRASGGFAAAGRALPLTFQDLIIGLVIVRKPSEDRPLFGAQRGVGASSATAVPSMQSTTARGGAAPPMRTTGKDLLAALRTKSAPPAAVVGSIQQSSLTPSPPPPPKAPRKGIDLSTDLSSDYVSEEEAAAAGISPAQLFSLAANMFVVKTIVPNEKIVVLENAVADMTLIIRNFGSHNATVTETSTSTSSLSQQKGGHSAEGTPALGVTYHRAGRVEESLFLRWRSDPEGFKTIIQNQGKSVAPKRPREEGGAADRSTPSSPSSVTLASSGHVTTIEKVLEGGGSTQQGAGRVNTWWAVRGIVVRYVPTSDPDHALFGMKGPVIECSRKDNRVTIKIDEGLGDDGLPRFTMVRCGIKDVDTVIPKIGGRVMVLRSDLAGEVTTVDAKSKDPETGDPMVTVIVDGKAVVLRAEEVCQLV